jgi:hypothetical protein
MMMSVPGAVATGLIPSKNPTETRSLSPCAAAKAATTNSSPMTCLKRHKPTQHPFAVTLPVGKIHYIEVS